MIGAEETLTCHCFSNYSRHIINSLMADSNSNSSFLAAQIALFGARARAKKDRPSKETERAHFTLLTSTTTDYNDFVLVIRDVS